jgi:histidinol-phosphate aminotransferase
MGDKVDKWIRPEVRALTAYQVPDASGLIKLDAMENPYGWPPEMVEAWLARLRGVTLNRYPDPRARDLVVRLRNYLGLESDQGLILGNGSDELIQLVILALTAPGRVVIAPEPTFVMYRMIAGFAGMDYHPVALRSDFSLDLPAMKAAIERYQPAVVFLAYPNNPTGNLWDKQDLTEILRATPGLVVIDEAYYPFAGRSWIPELGSYDNLLVMRTVSKLGLAGLRLGMLAGPPPWVEQIDKLRLPYNINVLTQVSAAFALEHRAVLDEQAASICAERDRLRKALVQLPGVEVFPSQANFLLLRVAPGRADGLFEGLLHRGVLIKKLDGSAPALSDCLRVTVGRPEENEAFLVALREIL